MKKEISVLKVAGMSCSHCENSIKKALGALEGVINTSVDLQAKQVTVEYDPEKIPLSMLKEIIDELGYEVEGEVLSNE